jgi:hypothetical protein
VAEPMPDPTVAAANPVDVAADHELVGALCDARRLAEGREDDAGWRELAGRVDRILDRIGVVDLDPTTAPAIPTDGSEPPTVGTATADHATASLLALLDRDDDDQLALANEAIRTLEDGLR